MSNEHNVPKVNFDDILDDDHQETVVSPEESFESKRNHIETAYKYAQDNNYYTQINTEKPSPLKNIMIQLPEDLVHQLNIYQAENNVTRKYLIMKALHEIGFKIRSIDLVKDGRSRK